MYMHIRVSHIVGKGPRMYNHIQTPYKLHTNSWYHCLVCETNQSVCLPVSLSAINNHRSSLSVSSLSVCLSL